MFERSSSAGQWLHPIEATYLPKKNLRSNLEQLQNQPCPVSFHRGLCLPELLYGRWPRKGV